MCLLVTQGVGLTLGGRESKAESDLTGALLAWERIAGCLLRGKVMSEGKEEGRVK